ncbi:MAG TPA: PQQ-binding-like beta-propeller repeat protein [Rickettsia endosymbiont of Pyrocoelia pectoralis]|nr:PQQ-binding-like beta-propeller repeat protein [Rickettsia endosymbiont of Pyrocoelia pectoralis]
MFRIKNIITAILLVPFMLSACNSLGPKRVKNIVELTPKLALQSNEPIYLDSAANIYAFNPNILKNKQYSFAKGRTVAAPVFAGDMVYALDIRSNVSAFSIGQNKVIWSNNLSKNKKDNYIGGGILHHNDKLYITYGSRTLVVLDAKSGYEIIRKELPDIIRTKPVMLNDNTVLVQTISNQTMALNAETLKNIWEYEGIKETLSASYFVTPIVYHDSVIVTYNSGHILALNIKNGEVKWNFEFANLDRIAIPNFEEASILCTPVVDHNNLYIATGLGKLIKLNLETGGVIWQVDAEDVQSMSLIGNSLFITNNARQIAAFNPTTGQVKFVADLNDGKDPKKLKSSVFLAPFASQDDSGKQNLNVISANGILYSFNLSDDANLNAIPNIVKIIKNIRYYGLTTNNNLYFSTDRKIIYSEVK